MAETVSEAVLYLDGAYVSAEKLVEAQAQGRELIGPAQAAPRKEGRFSNEGSPNTLSHGRSLPKHLTLFTRIVYKN